MTAQLKAASVLPVTADHWKQMTVGRLQDITGLNFGRGHKGPFRVLHKSPDFLNWEIRCSK